MEKNEKIETVKRNLRRLRKIANSIEVSLQVKERHEKRLEFLSTQKPTKEILEEVEKIKKNLSTLRLEESIKEANELEALYMEAISKLEPFDRTIILDGYINGKAYWKIGRDIGYTEIGVKKRIEKIIIQIAKIVYGS